MHSDVNNNFGSPAEAGRLPDISAAQGDMVDETIYSTDPGSHSDLVSDGNIGLIPESPSGSSATYSAGDEMDIDKESLEQDVDVSHKRVRSVSLDSQNPTPQKRLKNKYSDAPDFPLFIHPFKSASNPPKPSTAIPQSSTTHRLPKLQNNVGISRSATASRKLKEDMVTGKHVVDEGARTNFEHDCRIADSEAQFRYEQEKWKVFHSSCGKWQTMKEGYSSTRFRDHVNKCKATGSTNRFSTLSGFLSKVPPSKPKTKRNLVVHPCEGITERSDARVPKLIRRTGADGGGARSVTIIALELFKKMYFQLSTRRKSIVDKTQMHEWTFRLDRTAIAVHSTSCEKSVTVWDDSKGPHTCLTCREMLERDACLKSALRVNMPLDNNFKHLNYRFQGKSDAERYAKTQGLLSLIEDKVCALSSDSNDIFVNSSANLTQDTKNSVCVRYALGVLDGKYQKHEVFTGLVDAMVRARDREEWGVGLQNFEYTPALDEFAHICAITSPEAYRLLQRYFPLRTLRSHQSVCFSHLRRNLIVIQI